MIEAEANRIAMLNAAPPRAGILIPEAKGLFKPETANLTPFFWTVTPPVFFLGKENGGCGFAARRRHIPAPLGARKPTLFGPAKEKRAMYEYFHVKSPPMRLFLADFRLTPNTGTSSTVQRRKAGAMLAFCLCRSR